MRPPWPILLVALLIGIAVARVTATYRVYSQTYDEPAHLAAGMEWLDRGVYRYEPIHPPLGRGAIALGPWLAGVHSQGSADMWQEGNALLASRGTNHRVLALARAGVLPFFVLAAIVTYAWASAIAGTAAGVLAVLLFTTVPPVLAHAGLATTDMPGAAGLIAAFFLLVRWLEQPSIPRSLSLGGAIGLALLCKMSAVVLLPVGGVAIILVWLLAPGRSRVPRATRASLAIVTAVILVWAGYRFSVGPIPLSKAHDSPASAPSPGRTVTVPAPEWFRGLHAMLALDLRQPRKNFLLGAPRVGGTWYFFPVALAVKTPLPFLALAAAGVLVLGRQWRRRKRWQAVAPLAAAAALLALVMKSDINYGVRHVLSLYPLLAIAAAAGALALWRSTWRRPAGPAVAGGLIVWLCIESALAHPDYLPYFNQLAGSHPEQVLVDSDLDWGQDLDRLSDTLRARRVNQVALAYFGSADLTKHGLPPYVQLPEHTPTSGWVAVSLYCLQLGSPKGQLDSYAWLRHYRPVARVGRSILLYHIPSRRAAAHQWVVIPPIGIAVNRATMNPTTMNSTTAAMITTTVYPSAFSLGDFISTGSPRYSR
jgi:4-amino-4-deoxy-L-arabinose transferase-like glycosyltransferase